MADHDIPDDPFLERRLTTLALLPVPERPTLDDLAVRAPAEGEAAAGAAAGTDSIRRRSHRIWLLTGAAAAAVLLVVISVAAAVRSQDSGLASGIGPSLAGRAFVSVSVTDSGVPRTVPFDVPQQTPVTVTLSFAVDGGSLHASAGCNDLDARFTIEGDTLIVDDVERTERLCPGPYGGVDDWLTDVLASSPTLALDRNRLTLTSGATAIELLDREVAEPDLPLVGTVWRLESIIDGETVMSAQPLDASIQFAARPDPSTVDYAGNDGCRNFGGSIRWEGDEVAMVEWWYADDAATCSGGDHGAVIKAVMNPNLATTVDGSRLTIANRDKALVFRGAAMPVATSSPPMTTADPADAPTTTTVLARLEGPEAIGVLPGRRWEVESVVVDGVRTSAAPVTDRERAHLTFTLDPADPTWVAEAYDGCNGGGGRAAATGTTISFGGTGWEEMACPGIDDGVVATTVRSVLVGETTYETDGVTLTIRNGGRALELRNSGAT
jgi:heat shock protein HslJ